jgi:hypothetical protein
MISDRRDPRGRCEKAGPRAFRSGSRVSCSPWNPARQKNLSEVFLNAHLRVNARRVR